MTNLFGIIAGALKLFNELELPLILTKVFRMDIFQNTRNQLLQDIVLVILGDTNVYKVCKMSYLSSKIFGLCFFFNDQVLTGLVYKLSSFFLESSREAWNKFLCLWKYLKFWRASKFLIFSKTKNKYMYNIFLIKDRYSILSIMHGASFITKAL